MTGHACPGPECQRTVPGHMLACRSHWYAIPRPLRAAVWSAWRNGAGAGSPEHTAAIAAAIGSLRGDA